MTVENSIKTMSSLSGGFCYAKCSVLESGLPLCSHVESLAASVELQKGIVDSWPYHTGG